MKINVSAIQIDIQLGQPERNLDRLYHWVEKACSDGDPDIVLLPEMWNTGYDLDNFKMLSEKYTLHCLVSLQELCRARNICMIAGSMPFFEDGKLYNRSISLDNNGNIVHSYDKVHLFSLMNEESFFSPGNSIKIARMNSVDYAVAICYDLRFSPLFANYIEQGAKIIFLPAEWPNPRLNHWRTLLIARAIEFQCFFVSCNRVGKDLKNEYFGHSMIVSPWGEVIDELGSAEGICRGTIDLEQIGSVRSHITSLKDVRKDLY